MVWGKILLNISSTSPHFFTATLPIAATISNEGELIGNYRRVDAASFFEGQIFGITTTNIAQFAGTSTVVVSAREMTYSFT